MATVVIVAGTAGTGKSTIGEALRDHYHTSYLEADDVHPKENVEKMAKGIPLDDEDRWGWLDRISKMSTEKALESERKFCVASCSSLKKVYRDTIQKGSPETKFIYIFLYATLEELVKRTEARADHFMKSSMLQSQFDILQLPEADEPDSIILKVDGKTVDEITNQAVAFIDSRK